MNIISIGELIRQRRIELGLTQEQLCEGICEPSNISRIENGYQLPSRSKMTALLQRLGLPSEKYYALLSDVEVEISNLQAEITSHIVRREYHEGLEKLAQLETMIEDDDNILKQFILSCKVALGKRDKGNIVHYSDDERIEMLYEAIRLTVPRFDIDDLSAHLLSADEIKIINQIGITYQFNCQYKAAIAIFYELMRYIKKHFRTLTQSLETAPIVILIAYNYSQFLNFDARYEDSLEIAELGLEYSKSLRNSSYLGSLLFIKANDLYHLNRVEESRKYYLQSYYVYCALDDVECLQEAKEHIKELFGLNID